MQIEISDATFERLRLFVEQQGLPPTAIHQIADDTLRNATEQPTINGGTGNLVERFRKYRGLLRETTIEEIVADRHRGLA
jgi:hypothetical protein